MVKFQFCSDLHLEFYPNDVDMSKFLEPISPYLIISGDLCPVSHDNFKRFFEYYVEKFVKIFYITGNHEYYNIIYQQKTYPEINSMIIEILKNYKNVVFLHNSVYEFNDDDGKDLVILGTTLWSKIPNVSRGKARIYMNDFQKIYISYNKRLSVDDVNSFFENNVNWLNDMLAKYNNNKNIIVITHHLPTYKMIHKKYEDSVLNCCFTSDLDNLILSNPQIKYWLCGHTHSNINIELGSTKISTNPKGYPNENPEYSTTCIFEV